MQRLMLVIVAGLVAAGLPAVGQAAASRTGKTASLPGIDGALDDGCCQDDPAIQAVWAVNDGEKIKRFDLDNVNRSGNSVWDRGQVTLFSGRNETVAFQVIIQSGLFRQVSRKTPTPRLPSQNVPAGAGRRVVRTDGTGPPHGAPDIGQWSLSIHGHGPWPSGLPCRISRSPRSIASKCSSDMMKWTPSRR